MFKIKHSNNLHKVTPASDSHDSNSGIAQYKNNKINFFNVKTLWRRYLRHKKLIKIFQQSPKKTYKKCLTFGWILSLCVVSILVQHANVISASCSSGEFIFLFNFK